MVIRRLSRIRSGGGLMVELLVAMALLTGAVLPLAYSIAAEHRFTRVNYQRAVAMEIVDGELEVLAAGGWRHFSAGTHEYPVQAGAATNLPPGHLWLTIEPGKLRLRWQPNEKQHGGPVVREVKLQ